MDKDEEADEIVRRLSAPPKPPFVTYKITHLPIKRFMNFPDEFNSTLSTDIAAEIEKEVLEQLRKDYEKTVLHGS